MSGTPAYREVPVAGPLADVAVCGWRRGAGDAAEVLVLPDGRVDVVAGSDGRVFVAGPDLGPVVHRQEAGVGLVGVRLRAGAAGAVLGVDVDALRDRRVDLVDLWGAPARGVTERVMAAADPLGALTAALADRLAAVDGTARLDRPALAAAAALATGPTAVGPSAVGPSAVGPSAVGDAAVGSIASRVGLSERQLRRRFVRAVGYGPKAFARVARFRRFLDDGGAVADGRRSLADAAAAAGYADQSHLVRDCRALAGATPSALLATWWDGRNVQDSGHR